MTGRRDDHRDDRSQTRDESRSPEDDPRRSTDGAGASWRDREPTPRRDRAVPERSSTSVTASLVGLLTAGVRIGLDAVAIGLWVIFLTLLFLETSWPQWAFYGLLLGGVAIYVSITAPWTGRHRSTE